MAEVWQKKPLRGVRAPPREVEEGFVELIGLSAEGWGWRGGEGERDFFIAQVWEFAI